MNYNKNITKIVFSLVTLVFLAGCAPGLGTSLSLQVPESPVSKEYRDVGGQAVFIPVQVADVTDVRQSMFMAGINGRNILAQEKPEAVFRGLIENQVKQEGYNLSTVAETNISAEIREWFVDVNSKFPLSSAAAKASILLTVEIPATGRKFFAEYSGQADLSHPWLNQKKVEELLVHVMENALATAFKDERLVQVLGS